MNKRSSTSFRFSRAKGCLFFFLAMLLFPPSLHADLLNSLGSYTVQTGDSPEIIAARLGISKLRLIRENGIDPARKLVPGTVLKVNTRRISPPGDFSGIVINVPERMLYYFRDKKLIAVFPVGLGMRESVTGPDWRSPRSRFTIVKKEKNPTWYVPESIQEEMEEMGKEVKTRVPPGPDNPLGRFALKTSLPGILIHETIHPSTVHQFRSHGCIRVMPEHMGQFFEEVAEGTTGELIYMPVKAALSSGKIYLEVHRDWYSTGIDLFSEAQKAIAAAGALDRADWNKVRQTVREKSGIAEDVTQ